MRKISERLSLLYIYHYLKLVFRAMIFIGALVFYIVERVNGSEDPFGGIGAHPIFWGVIWAIFVLGMLLRFFPSSAETIGCQKQFKRNFIPTEETEPSLTPARSTVIFTLCWSALNILFGVLYLTGLFDAGILILISMTYGMLDIVCILFFCPIRDWFLKNKCCADCRIYNWDYAMIFTPLFFLPHPYTWSLLGISLALLITWEIIYRLHPERFAKNTNASLMCENCKEKPCRHKKRIARIVQKGKERLSKLSWWPKNKQK